MSNKKVAKKRESAPVFGLLRHLNSKLSFRLEDLRPLWEDLPDAQRLEVVKSLAWTARDRRRFRDHVVKELTGGAFDGMLD